MYIKTLAPDYWNQSMKKPWFMSFRNVVSKLKGKKKCLFTMMATFLRLSSVLIC